MQAAERARELERVYQSRRGHAPQISISDDNHHVTEAIGDMYGHEDDYLASRSSPRPLSFISSPLGDALEAPLSPTSVGSPPKSPLRAHMSNDSLSPNTPNTPTSPNGFTSRPGMPPRRSSSGRGGQNGTFAPLSRTNSDTAEQQFPLHDIDYESSPASLAQELSNLQAIRRMSMDVNTADPDLPSFKSVAPQHFSEDEDPTKLFWVPARLHPELAPKEFKTFIEEKVHTIRRRSGDAESLSPDGALGRQASGGGLRRKKSMLSRQIDSPSGYRDGAERLERKRSGAQPKGGLADLQELETMAEDPTSLIRRLSIDTGGRKSAEGDASGDVPILPGATAALKRSTRTNYRRGSVRRGERVPFARRIGTRQHETDTEESPASPTFPKDGDFFSQGLQRVQSEPARSDGPENFSRPTRKRSIPIDQGRPDSAEDRPESPSTNESQASTHPVKPFHSRIASNGRTTAPLPGYNPTYNKNPVPQIIETPPPQEPKKTRSQMLLPERHSSRGPPPSNPQQQPSNPRTQSHPQPHPQSQPQPQHRQPAPRQNKHAQAAQNSPIKPEQSFDDLITHPSPLPGNNTRTDNLSIIPNLAEEKKPDKNDKKLKISGDGGSRKTSWGWLVGGGDKEKEKKEKEERDKEMAKKVKNKLSKTQDKSHDNTRLDVLQHSIDGNRGRESVVLDRDAVKLEEERKKESSRKSSGGDSKKEKEAGLFSSIFGGGKKKSEKESTQKKGSSMRGLSPEPPPRILKPDIDYNWTRFSILEERAIYRMAHIKLANPRRELYSQVLLSNFMYSYLAKVQQMHPQIQIGTSAHAKQQQKQAAAKEKKEQQPEEFTQYQRYQETQEPAADKGGNAPNNDHAQDDNQQRPDSRDSQHSQNTQHRQQRDQHKHQQPRDSHHSQYSASNDSSYSVADSKSYMGVSAGGKSQQSYYGYDDSDQSSRDEEMW